MRHVLVATLAVVALTVAIGHAAAAGPLILTPYLPNNYAQAQALSKVEGIGNFTSYSGFFTVNATYQSTMYFWYFPSQDGNTQAPVLLWLQGGPGASSLFGLFGENGPFMVNADKKTLRPNPGSWNAHYSLLYIDNPVGVGFSYTNNPSGFSTSSRVDVANNLYSALVQFYQLFPSLQSADFYVTGESYAGHYIPSISYKIWEMNNSPSSVLKIPMKGLAIGDGAMDPSQFTIYSDLLFSIGFADGRERLTIINYERRIMEAVHRGDTVGAFHIFDELLNGDFYPYPTYFANITGLSNYFNLLSPVYPANPFSDFLNQPSTQQALHVGSIKYTSYNATVEKYLIPDWMRSMEPILPTLLENYKVLIYNGNLDIILGPAAAENFLVRLPWKGQHQFNQAQKNIWRLADGTVAGFTKTVGTFTQAVVLNAGHMVPADQPVSGLDLITKFINGQF